MLKSLGRKKETPTEIEVRRATDEAFNVIPQKIMKHADELSQVESNKIIDPTEDDLPVDELPPRSNHRTVLGGIFHFIYQKKLPIHHEYKTYFFLCLRA